MKGIKALKVARGGSYFHAFPEYRKYMLFILLAALCFEYLFGFWQVSAFLFLAGCIAILNDYLFKNSRLNKLLESQHISEERARDIIVSVDKGAASGDSGYGFVLDPLDRNCSANIFHEKK